MAKKVPLVFSHWYHLTENLQESALTFYGAVEEAVKRRQLTDVKISRVDYREGGILSAKREYLRLQRKNLIFDICSAPFGTGFFVSWWLGEPVGFLRSLPFFRPVLTYYRLDTALMFQESVSSAVMEVLDGITKAKGLRELSEAERKPLLRELFKR